MSERTAHGTGIGTFHHDTLLDVWFPAPALGAAGTSNQTDLASLETTDQIRGVVRKVVSVDIADLDAAPSSTADVWLRLHLLSHRLVRPHAVNLDGAFGLLENVAWTNLGPCPIGEITEIRARAGMAGLHLSVTSIDKFPRMTDYVVPSGVRIADADRVRLGAHVAEGTTVMHEGFINFNAGTLGTAMVEGRISAGVVVGAGSDIGGGASIMGTLSGGGQEVISVGEGCLIGANAGIGISLGDNCIVAAGTYVTAGAKVLGPNGTIVKASTLSGHDNLTFWTNSQTGVLEARSRIEGPGVTLNDALHGN